MTGKRATPKAAPGGTYGQYCPLALAAEVLCERWTLLVVSRLIDGCRTFNEIHAGVPRMSPALLSKRLTSIEAAGLLERVREPGKRRFRYEPTEACLALDDIVMQLAAWGQHWARDMNLDDLDPAFLAWSMHMRLDPSALPPGRTVVQFRFTGVPSDCRQFWLVSTDGEADMCLKDPGYETDLLVRSDLRRFVECWRGYRDLKAEIRAERITLSGPRSLCRALPQWLMLSALAPIPRHRPGREQRLQSGR